MTRHDDEPMDPDIPHDANAEDEIADALTNYVIRVEMSDFIEVDYEAPNAAEAERLAREYIDEEYIIIDPAIDRVIVWKNDEPEPGPDLDALVQTTKEGLSLLSRTIVIKDRNETQYVKLVRAWMTLDAIERERHEAKEQSNGS